ncbi:MAG: YihY/virulence factor BrkB family protein [Cytophagales bacterium]|nr:YihY/virulence factor BrkB family protein [Cytophagales bacterium]
MPKVSLIKFLLDTRTFKNIIHRLDNIHLRKKEVSMYKILINLFTNLNNDDILHKASSVAFSFTLAVFPAIIFLFTLLPYIPIPDMLLVEGQDFQANLQELIGEVAMFGQVSQTIEDLLKNPRGELLSFSVLLSLFLSTNGMMELAQTFNKIYKTIEKRSYWRTRLIATFLTIILALVLFVSILLLTVGNFALKHMVKEGLMAENFEFYSIFVLKFIVLFILFLLAVSIIYYFAPALHNRWKFISIGSVCATSLSLLVSYFFSSYITNFGTYNKLYGSIGAMIALMVWIYLISIILLIGFEVNASIDQAAQQGEEEHTE